MINIATSTELNIGSLSLIISLSTKLADRTEFAALCIKNAIASNMPSEKILETVKDMITDNPEAMRAMIGDDLAAKILIS